MAKFTQGDWTVMHNNNDDTTYIVSDSREVGSDIIAQVYRLSEYEENAALFAASKDMLAALEQARDLLKLQANRTPNGGLMMDPEQGKVYLAVVQAINQANNVPVVNVP